MSAPDTHIEKQTRKHWPALGGIIAAIILAAIAAFAMSVWTPAPDETTIPANAGAVVSDTE